MSLHKITAGSGYDYLTREVARHDSTENARVSLASYYTERGEVPGVWVGSGLAGLDGLDAGDEVTAEQMRSLFGAGFHPLAEAIRARMAGSEHTQAEYAAAIRLGKPFTVFDPDVSEFRVQVARAFTDHNRARGACDAAPIPLEVRARIRTGIARDMFRAEYGRDVLDARELSGHLARLSRQQTTAVAGYDLTFSPVKSVSALWALADPPIAADIERAHHAAVTDALGFIEREALFTRLGKGGVRQVEVRGLVAAAFTHRDSRAGDPDLHTHVAVANKVQTLDGRWLSIDGRVLFKANVAASEVYNTALERRLADTLGLRFEPRPDTDPGKRPVREIVGVRDDLLRRWSSRRHSIEARRAELAASFTHTHGRPPTAIEQIALAQQATLDTRDAKHAPRTLAEQRTTWRAEALAVCGSQGALEQMFATTLHRSRSSDQPGVVVGGDRWFAYTSGELVATLQASRSTWQDWHVRAEAYRIARTAEIPHAHLGNVVDRLVAQALGDHSVPVTPANLDPVSDPRVLRRSDGTSMYTVTRSRLYTSPAILDAEGRLVAAAGRSDGVAASDTDVDLALLESAANGVQLNPGQEALVRGLATSGRRVQVAIAPAGSGKTTAMATLSRAWSETGGTVIGLAPSAAAADQLRQQINTHTDTLAKLTWHLDHDGPIPDWIAQVGPTTLVVIDEAGMADTISLDRAVSWILQRGASVRLIGDDQQLAAVGAGGVLRDIEATHGVLRLRELVRFADPAEAAASLALREGRTEALGFYLDRGRVHVGDQATLLGDLFDAWAADRGQGLDSIMLAPTRDLVADLNRRARDLRLGGRSGGREVLLADGNRAGTGDTIITRANDRRLRVSATDWVKNGDRWTITSIDEGGRIRATHSRSGLHVTLPADYTATAVQLGYATTIHTAQGVSVDTVHGLATPEVARQPLYTMLTRGRHANHVYLQVVGDGAEHTVIRPETINPDTPTDLLEAILARDDSPVSATSQRRHATDPGRQLHDAAARYDDALTVAAETVATLDQIATLERRVEAVLPGLTAAKDWTTLRTHLLILAADGREPIGALLGAYQERPLRDAHDPAAVLTWRLDGTLTGGPLPWLNRIPQQLAAHPHWGPYLTRRARLVASLAEQVTDAARASTGRPAWLTGSLAEPTPGTLADIAVWRAAHGIDDADLRPTGPRLVSHGEHRWQQILDARVAEDRNPALHEWAPLLRRLAPAVDHDPYTATLARLLAQLAGAGVPAHTLLHQAGAQGALPDDHAAAALWWRVTAQLTPAHHRGLDADQRVPADWPQHLPRILGAGTAAELQQSPYWPALAHAVEDALQRGWTLDALLTNHTVGQPGTVDAAQALAWRITVATDPSPYTDDHLPVDPAADTPPDDLLDGWTPPEPPPVAPDRIQFEPDADAWVDLDLGVEAALRGAMGVPEPTEEQIREQLDRRDAWHDSHATPDRLIAVNTLAADFYTRRYPDSWASRYLTDRLGTDLIGHPDYQPGYAPDQWTALIDHLRHRGVTDTELLTAGLAATASSGRLIDRFRDRVMLPITDPDGQILGFVGRRNPTHDTDPGTRTPKYLNTPDTPLFHKGAQLFAPAHLERGGVTPVIVEGPLDAVAVTLAGDGRYVGVAPLGTALTDDQAAQLHRLGRTPIVATDNDPAGRAAAERDYWKLTPYQLHPRYAALPDGSDPADLVGAGHSEQLDDALAQARPLAHELLTRRLTGLPSDWALTEALKVIAAQPADQWPISEAALIGALDAPAALVRLALKEQIAAFTRDPCAAASQAYDQIKAYQARLFAARTGTNPPLAPNVQERRAEVGPATPAAPGRMARPHDEDLRRSATHPRPDVRR